MNWQDITNRIFHLYGDPPKTKLAEMLGIHKSVVSKWTTKDLNTWRHPPLELLEKIAAEQNITWDWLLEGREPKFRK